MEQTARARLVIINADDYGFSPGITDGILQAHRCGIVTSTTIAANMPAAEAAVARLAEVPGLGVGVHLNVSQGPALSKGGLALADAGGIMHLTGAGVLRACLLPRLLDAIEREYDAQIRWVLDHGLKPTHLDSHRHAHGFPPIFARVARLARRYNIPLVRWYWERPAGSNWPRGPAGQRGIRRVLNLFAPLNARLGADLRGTNGTWGVEHTGCIDTAWLCRAAAALPPGVTEIMTHPGRGDDAEIGATRLRDSRQTELAALCDPAVRDAFCRERIELVHYGHLHGTRQRA